MDTTKIIIGHVSARGYTTTAPIIKEDYGIYLKIEGVELPSTYEVDFSNSENSGTSVTMIGNADGVLIPSQFISTGKDIFAFLYHVGVDFGRTIYKFRIPNKVRPDRTDETPTPEEQSTIDQAISALNSAVAQTAQDVIDADASAQAASQSESNAHDSELAAQGYAQDASGYASDAQGYANTASQKATAAGNSADQAAQIKTDIEGYVSTAQGYAQTATDKAAQASQSATNASNSATTASTKAGEASASATTASTKASEASGYASTASQKATEASQSASQALGYKTDAESAKTASQTAQGLAEQAQTAAETAQGKAEDAQEAAETAAASIQSSAAQITTNTTDILKAFPTDSASGSIASFSDGADDIPLKSLIVDINPVQDLSQGDPSPENICPISGWTGCEVSATGYNVWDEQWESGKYTNGNKGANASMIRCKKYIPVKPYTTYYFNRGVNNGNMWAYFYDRDKVCLNPTLNGYNVGNSVVTTPDKCHYVRIFLSAQTEYQHDVAINYPSTDHDYHPYVGKVIPISWETEAGTVYGGRLDVLSGVLTVYPYYASYNGETLTGEWISDRDVYAVGTTPTIGAQVVNIGAEGTEYQLTPYEVKSLLGVNNIWADTGDTEVTYRADPTLYIQRLTEPDADMIADSNIVSGQYFMVGNSLYLATANIASGAQVIVGTNATRKSLSEALNEINA